MLALAACTQPASPSSLPTVAVTGRALAGPTCPVERQPPDPNCAPRPVAGAEILAVGPDREVVARATTAADGAFELRLPAGRYELIGQPVAGLMGVPPPLEIEVAEEGVGEIVLEYDTGIR